MATGGVETPIAAGAAEHGRAGNTCAILRG
jgi:hypothetical protein